MTHSFPYHGDDFCLEHGREHMRSAMGNPIPYCEACERSKQWAADQARKHNTECEAEIERIHGHVGSVGERGR